MDMERLVGTQCCHIAVIRPVVDGMKSAAAVRGWKSFPVVSAQTVVGPVAGRVQMLDLIAEGRMVEVADSASVWKHV